MSQFSFDKELIREASSLSTASLHEAASRRGALPSMIKPLEPKMKVCGPAFPVLCPPGDNLFIHRALIAAQPGEVLVVNTCDGLEFGYWGEIMASAAIARGLAGLVIAGGVRDSLRLIELSWPTFSARICIRGTTKNPELAGTVGEPVTMGDVTVQRGDLILGDADGVMALSPEIAGKAVAGARDRDAKEIGILKRLAAGATIMEIYGLPP